MYELGICKRNITRADKAAVEKLSRFGVATIHEAMGRVGLMKTYMRPIYKGARMCGTAVTVLLQPGDNWMMHVAAEQIQPGDVVVAACTTDNFDGFFGDGLSGLFLDDFLSGLLGNFLDRFFDRLFDGFFLSHIAPFKNTLTHSNYTLRNPLKNLIKRFFRSEPHLVAHLPMPTRWPIWKTLPSV